MRSKLSFFLFFLLAVACTKPVQLTGFDVQSWQADPNGCLGYRKGLIDTLMAQKHKLLGLGQDEILVALGEPTRHEIHKRSRQFFIYAISSTQACNPTPKQLKKENLTLRFNALGRVHEIIYYR